MTQSIYIPGQEKVKSTFKKYIGDQRVPHALLLTGPAGSGKLALALYLTQSLLCQHKKDNTPCGECPSCQKTKKNIHPDVHFSFPVIKHDKKTREKTTSDDFLEQWRSFLDESPFRDTQSWANYIEATNQGLNINVADCNNILRKLNLKSYQGSYKIQIIWAAEYLRTDGNRLLKLIEEPTDDTIIILITDNQQDLLNTILSRCQILQVGPFSDDEIADFIASKFDIKGDQIDEIKYLAAGNIQQAMEMAAGNFADFSDLLLDWMRAAYTGYPDKISAWVDQFIALGKTETRSFFKYAIHFLGEYLKSWYYNDDMTHIKLSTREKDALRRMKKIIDIEKTKHLITLINKAYRDFNRNVNPKIMLTAFSYDIEAIMKQKSDALSYD